MVKSNSILLYYWPPWEAKGIGQNQLLCEYSQEEENICGHFKVGINIPKYIFQYFSEYVSNGQEVHEQKFLIFMITHEFKNYEILPDSETQGLQRRGFSTVQMPEDTKDICWRGCPASSTHAQTL